MLHGRALCKRILLLAYNGAIILIADSKEALELNAAIAMITDLGFTCDKSSLVPSQQACFNKLCDNRGPYDSILKCDAYSGLP